MQKDCAAPARGLYLGPRFQFSWLYAEKLGVDKIFVLSAKYGVVEPGQVIEPYKRSFDNNARLPSRHRGVVQPMGVAERQAWVQLVVHQLSLVADLEKDFFIILGGQRQRYYLHPLSLTWKPGQKI